MNITLFSANGPSLDPWQLFLLAGTIVERGHRMDNVPVSLSIAARTLFNEWHGVAKHRGFADYKRLREACRVGRVTPRGERLARDVISRISAAEMAILVERSKRFSAWIADPTPANGFACRHSPVFSVSRGTAQVDSEAIATPLGRLTFEPTSQRTAPAGAVAINAPAKERKT